MRRDWRSFEVPARKSLHCCEWTLKGDSDENSDKRKLQLHREHLSNFQQSKTMNGKDHSDEVSEMRNMIYVDRYKMAKNLAQLCLCSSVL